MFSLLWPRHDVNVHQTTSRVGRDTFSSGRHSNPKQFCMRTHCGVSQSILKNNLDSTPSPPHATGRHTVVRSLRITVVGTRHPTIERTAQRQRNAVAGDPQSNDPTIRQPKPQTPNPKPQTETTHSPKLDSAKSRRAKAQFKAVVYRLPSLHHSATPPLHLTYAASSAVPLDRQRPSTPFNACVHKN